MLSRRPDLGGHDDDLSWWDRFLSWRDRHAMTLAILLLTGVAALAIAGVRWEAGQRSDDVDQESKDRAAAVEAAAQERRDQICAESRNLRLLVSELIDTAVDDSGDGGLDLTAPRSFALLPASVQDYLLELAAQSSNGDEGPSLAERLTEFQETRLDELPEFCR